MTQNVLALVYGGVQIISDLLIVVLFWCATILRHLFTDIAGVQWTGHENIKKCSNKSEIIWATWGILFKHGFQFMRQKTKAIEMLLHLNSAYLVLETLLSIIDLFNTDSTLTLMCCAEPGFRESWQNWTFHSIALDLYGINVFLLWDENNLHCDEITFMYWLQEKQYSSSTYQRQSYPYMTASAKAPSEPLRT